MKFEELLAVKICLNSGSCYLNNGFHFSGVYRSVNYIGPRAK